MPKKNRMYGYVRVSTKEQNETRQVISILGFGVKESDIFIDKQSGEDFNRPAYLRLMKRLRKGDTIVIKSIDRLGRDYERLLNNGGVFQRRYRQGLLFLICRFRIPDRRIRI